MTTIDRVAAKAAPLGAAAALLIAAMPLATTPLAAQNRPAVATPPELGPAPRLTLPAVKEARLPNGIRLQVVEMRSVPAVQARLVIAGGARLDGENPGLATFTAGMLTEGAGGRDAFALSEETEYLGASLFASASWDATSISLGAPKRTFARAFGLLADVVLRPTFRADDVTRQRDLRLASLLQQRDQPAAVASLVFSRAVFPAGHPYHNPLSGDSSSTTALDSTLVRNYWERAADPRQATLIITGDISLDEARALATEKLGAWRAPARPLTPTQPNRLPTPERPVTRVILVDKPDAAQSIIRIGAPGVARSSRDYAAITLMNTILGGSFSSRLNDILREQKGFTYGAGSGFAWQPVPGPFTASAAVRTTVTDSSVAIFFREFERIRQDPIPVDELERARAYITLGALGDFETTRQVVAELGSLNTFGLPVSTITADLEAIRKLTAADVQSAARQYLDPARLTVIIVGDVAKIRPGIEALQLGPVLLYDHNGRLLGAPEPQR
jgi:predicted Zn-dependent peptidase